jgi:hypothetical protein
VHGYLQDASKLTCEYISAMLGNGPEFFGLSGGLHATSTPVWLPHNLIDQLLLELRENSQEPDYHKVNLLVTPRNKGAIEPHIYFRIIYIRICSHCFELKLQGESFLSKLRSKVMCFFMNPRPALLNKSLSIATA